MNRSYFHKAEVQARHCQIFSNSHRIMILWALFEKELSVGDLAKEIQASLQNTSQHLRLMRDRGFVKSRREGSVVLYSLTDKALSEDCQALSKSNQK